MLVNEDIICFSSIDWDFNWQGHQEIMSRLAAAGNRVLFVENTGVRAPRPGDYNRLVSRIRNWRSGFKGIRMVEPNLYVFSPLLLPFPYSGAARWINRRLMLRVIRSWQRSMRFSSPLVWSFLPSALTRTLIEGLNPRLVVYYCIDSFADSSPGASRIREPEQRMIRQADLVFVTSEKLREHCQAHNSRVYKFPFTVDYEPFERAREDTAAPVPADIAGIEGPVAGYVGGLHRWVDQDLIVKLAGLLPECSFVLVGPEQEPMDRLRALPNVYLTGGKPHAELPLYLKRFDAGLIPYLRTPYTENVYPTKLNEYLAMGLPVISTPIREAELFAREHPGLAVLCPDAESMASAIRESLAARGTAGEEQLRRRRIELARENAWPSRIERMSALVSERLADLRESSGRGWREELAGLFSAYRRRALALGAAVALTLAVVFWSPLVFLAASPLAAGATEPVPADVILVFGGGVGETGRPGTSTIERSSYAAGLYSRGLGGKLVFSSGYQQYSTRDVENMHRIAIADNVPVADIILEQRSANNHENVVNCLALMDSLGMSSANVVTGRYNTLRTRLLIRRGLASFGGRFSPDSFRVTPAPHSIFFDKREGSRPAQWRAVIHEYLALAYYKARGLI